MVRLGTEIGMARRGKILKINSNGTIKVTLDEVSLTRTPITFDVSIPNAWFGPNGEFIGGTPIVGASVSVSQGQGNEWFFLGYIKQNNALNPFISGETNLLSDLKRGRALIQDSEGNKVIVGPDVGIMAGNKDSFIQIDPDNKILSNNFDSNFSFTEASRSVDQVIKRDVFINKSRNVLGSVLESHSYDKNLLIIGMDPDTSIGIENFGSSIRNLPLAEKREIVYEFAKSYGFTNDSDESANYLDSDFTPENPKINRNEMRSDTLNLSLEYPNNLIETIKGTAVDIYGNILDINRNILPIGQIDALSLRKNSKKDTAFENIRKQLRKSIAYSFTLNARKDTIETPDIAKNSDYARERSRFSFDLDKEGQFKLNIPSSSEIGNIPLLVRTENYSTILANETGEIHPNEFSLNEDRKDIFLEGFGVGNIGLSGGDHDLDGYTSPVDRFSGNVIKFGTAHHDILNVCSEFQESANFKKAGLKLVTISDNHPLNATVRQLPKIVSDLITVSGADANAGGRSGVVNLDGFISLNIGANTIDRQSLWIDTAGSVIASYGRDKRGISYAANLDGDMFIQIGGPGITSGNDSRFASENDAYRNGAMDIRIFVNGQMLIIRGDETGLHFVSPGRMTFTSQQNMVFKSNSHIMFEGEQIMMYAETAKRIIKKVPGSLG